MDRKRPGALLAIATIGLVLGGLGGCAGVAGVVGQLFEDRMNALSQDLMNNQPGMTPDMIEAQQGMQRRLQELTGEWKPALVGANLAHLATSLALLIASILLLRWHPRAPALFIAAAATSIVVDALVGGLGAYIQSQTGEIMDAYMRDLSAANPAPGVERTLGAAATASTAAGLCFTGAWLLLKLGYYIAGIVYTNKPAVRALFAPSAPPAA